MTRLTLNGKLLTILAAVKAKQKLAIIEMSIDGLSNDWMKSLREYFYGLPKALTEEVGLKQNEMCIRAIERFEIPDIWLTTPSDKLYQFEFSY